MKRESYNQNLAQRAFEFCSRAYRIPRSIVSDGNLLSFKLLEEYLPVPIDYVDIPSGTDFNGWVVPNSWNLKSASLISPNGEELIDLEKSNLYVVVGSRSIQKELTLDELLDHIHTIPNLPEAIPYVTSYYSRLWGFCLPYKKVIELKQGMYKVNISVDEPPAAMRIGEVFIKGKEEKEIFFSTYFCHPQMANNELSGPSLWSMLINYVWEKSKSGNLRYSYRFYIGPETIGAIYYLSNNYKQMKERILAGYVLTCVGVESNFVFMPSRTGKTFADRVALQALSKYEFETSSFFRRGSDERHWCSPAVDLPVCSIMTKKYHEYPEYHTSLDDLNFISPAGLKKSADVYAEVIEILESNQTFINKNLGEPRLDRLDLYPEINSIANQSHMVSRDVLNILILLDGKTDTIMLAQDLNLDYWRVFEILSTLYARGVINK
jgi:aminopeptidase-like protein